MSRPPVVIDASVLLARLLREPERALVASATVRWIAAGTRLLAPDHLWLELTHPLVRRYRWRTEEVIEGLQLVDELGITTIPIERTVLLLAVDRAERTGLSVYDATYGVLAQVSGATLATFDERLRSAFPELLEPGFGEVPPRRLSEVSEGHVSGPGANRAADRSAVGRYLGVLRRRLLAEAESGRGWP